jgi:hypothetical protein
VGGGQGRRWGVFLFYFLHLSFSIFIYFFPRGGGGRGRYAGVGPVALRARDPFVAGVVALRLRLGFLPLLVAVGFFYNNHLIYYAATLQIGPSKKAELQRGPLTG